MRSVMITICASVGVVESRLLVGRVEPVETSCARSVRPGCRLRLFLLHSTLISVALSMQEGCH